MDVKNNKREACRMKSASLMQALINGNIQLFDKIKRKLIGKSLH